MWHLDAISVVDGSTFNWCEQNVLRDSLSKNLLFAKIAEPKTTVLIFKNHFRDRIAEVHRGHLKCYQSSGF